MYVILRDLVNELSVVVQERCVRLPCKTDALIWHNLTPDEICHRLGKRYENVVFSWDVHDSCVWIIVKPAQLQKIPSSIHIWSIPLPPLSIMLAEVFPTLADVFCANSATLYILCILSEWKGF